MNTVKRPFVAAHMILVCTLACAFFISNPSIASATTTATTTIAAVEPSTTTVDLSSAAAPIDVNVALATAETENCGTITAPENWPNNWGSNATETIDIADCDNPFGLSTGLTMPYRLLVGGEQYDTDALIETEGGTLALPIQYTGSPSYDGVKISLFKHDGADYVYIDQEEGWREDDFDQSEVQAYAESYFSTQAAADLYTEIYFSDDQWAYFIDENDNDIIDSETGQAVIDRYDDFDWFLDEQRVIPPDPISSGTYTVVFDEYQPILTSQSWWRTFAQYIVPVAHAQGSFEVRRFAITFTLTEAEPECQGTCASSVLFLPGIQASRLYEDRFGFDEKVWEPLNNGDVRQLAMTASGESVNEIYTKDIIDEVFLLGSVYGGFSAFLDSLKASEENVIQDWAPYAYDWRYSVQDIAEYGTQYKDKVVDAISEIERLKQESYTEKVTIIAHSNGGLLAKAIMQRLEAEGRIDLIDSVILIAVPQTGTPKALGTVLHGYDQTIGYGLIVNAKTAREVINNLPGVYGLLPSERYVDELNEPIITFQSGSLTDPYRALYGDTIDSSLGLQRFLEGSDIFERDINDEVNLPARANSAHLAEANVLQADLDTWRAPAGVSVVEVVGTGLSTMKAAEYRTLFEDECLQTGGEGTGCLPEAQLKPFALLSKYGDGTVMQRSAEAYQGEKDKYFVNLREIENSNPNDSITHHNIIEATSVQALVKNLIAKTQVIENQFISQNHTEFDDVYDIEVIDSPIRMLATDEFGNQTGVVQVDGEHRIVQDIPGSQYFEFGGSKYIVVPHGTNRTTTLYGEAYGGYTLTTAVLSASDVQSTQSVLENASTTPSLVATYSNIAGEYSSIQTDLDGDGEIDLETDLEGNTIDSDIVTYDTIRIAIVGLNLPRRHEQTLLSSLNLSEYFYKKSTIRSRHAVQVEKLLLHVLDKKLEWCVLRGLITEGQYAVLKKLISELNASM